MDNNVCYEKFHTYLKDVKKSSSNTLSSYLRDIRQFGGYLDSHEEISYIEADEDVLCAKSFQSRPTLCDPMGCSPPGHQAPLSMGFSRQEY